MVFSMGFGATSLGVARATLDAATDLARGKTPQGLKAMKDNNAVQGLIGRTEATLRAARAYLYTTAAEVWRDLARGEPLTEQHRIALRIAATWTIHQSAAVVDTAYHMAGATAVFAANKFERRFRDMHAIAQQIQARDTHYEDAGKAILSTNLERAADGAITGTACSAVQRTNRTSTEPRDQPLLLSSFWKLWTESLPRGASVFSCSKFDRSRPA